MNIGKPYDLGSDEGATARAAARAIGAEGGQGSPRDLASAGYVLYFACPLAGRNRAAIGHVLAGLLEAAVEQEDVDTVRVLGDAIKRL